MDYYSAISSGYDALHGEEQDRKLTALLRHVTLRPGMKILDVGCATGRSARFFPGCDWHGIEPAQGLIDQASPEIRLRITRGVAEALPSSEKAFDMVLCLTVLHNTVDPERATEEMRRVCKTNGTLLISILKKSRKTELRALLEEQFFIVKELDNPHDALFVCVPKDI